MARHIPRTHEIGDCMIESARECTKPNQNIQSTVLGKEQDEASLCYKLMLT